MTWLIAEPYNRVQPPYGHLASRKAVEKWVADTPEDFCFTVKASRYLTHVKRLADAPERPLPEAEPTAGWTFVRLHRGSHGRRGNYSPSELEQWAERISDCASF